MYISRLIIRNFRNFESLDTSIGPGVTCIIGDNNTGKSNLLHAIRLAADINLPNYHRELSEHDLHSTVDFTVPQQVLISIEFSDFVDNINEGALTANWLLTGDQTARLTYRFRPKSTVRTDYLQGNDIPELNLTDYQWEWTGGGNLDPLKIEWFEDDGSSFQFSNLQAYQVLFLNALRDVISELKQPGVSPLAKLLKIMEPTELEKIQAVEVLKEANKQVGNHDLLKRLAISIERAYNNAAGEAHNLSINVGLSVPSFASIEKALTLILSSEFVENFDPFRNGLGLNNVLYIALVLEFFEQRQKKQQSAGQLLLIEEPEAHIHPQLQRVLYDAVAQKEIQTLITTHSTHLVSHAGLNTFIVLNNNGEAAVSSATIAQKAGLTSDDIRDLERFLDATRSTLLFARKVILVEGPAELFLIPVFAEKVMNIDLDRLGISVIAIHGAHFEAYSKLLGPDGLNKTCAIITDGDITEGEQLPRDTKQLARGQIKVFQCATTFERELALPGLLEAVELAATDLGATTTSKKIKAERLKPQQDLAALGLSILSLAKAQGKGRFAQVLSRHDDKIKDVPPYIKQALTWISD